MPTLKSIAAKDLESVQIARCPHCNSEDVYRRAGRHENEGPTDHCANCGYAFPHKPGTITAQQHIDRVARLLDGDGHGMELLSRAAIMLASSEDEAGHWVTIGAGEDEEGESHGGAHVFIRDGRIVKGPKSLAGKSIASLKKNTHAASTTTARTAEFRQRVKAHREKGLDTARAVAKAHGEMAAKAKASASTPAAKPTPKPTESEPTLHSQFEHEGVNVSVLKKQDHRGTVYSTKWEHEGEGHNAENWVFSPNRAKGDAQYAIDQKLKMNEPEPVQAKPKAAESALRSQAGQELSANQSASRESYEMRLNEFSAYDPELARHYNNGGTDENLPERVPQTPSETFAKVGKQRAELQRRVGAALNGLPDGTDIAGWKKFTTGGDAFWQKGKRVVSSHSLPEEVGDKAYEAAHRHVVESAIASGKTVPPEVMNEYPNLMKREPTPVQHLEKAKAAHEAGDMATFKAQAKEAEAKTLAGKKPPIADRKQLRQEIHQAYKDQGGGLPVEVYRHAESLQNPFTFKRGSAYEGEVKARVGAEGGKEGVGIARSGAINFTHDATKAGGEDAINSFRDKFGNGKGEDYYWQLARERAGYGWQDALEHARNSNDPELKFKAALHDTLLPAKERPAQEGVDPHSLKVGEEFTINHVPVEVKEDMEGDKVLSDHGKIPDTPVAALRDKLPVDKGTLREKELPKDDSGDFFADVRGEDEPAQPELKSQAGKNLDVDTSRQFGLFAKDKSGNPVEVGEHAGQANLFNPAKYKTAEKPAEAKPEFGNYKAEDTGMMFDAKSKAGQEAAKAEPEKSKGHIGFYTAPDKTKYEVYKEASGELHRAPISNVIDVTTGNRIGRWEATKANADQRAALLLGKEPKLASQAGKSVESQINSPSGRVEDALQIGEHNLPQVYEHYKKEIEDSDQKLSPNRAGELAAIRIRNAIRSRLSDIHDRARHGEITPDEEKFYDNIYVDQWDYGRTLEKMSGSRTMIADEDHPLANRPLNAPPLGKAGAAPFAEGQAKEGSAPKAKGQLNSVRAPAGGKVSEVDGKFYKGGSAMPIHGEYSGQEKSPSSGLKSKAATAVESQHQQRSAPQPMTPEQIEEHRQRVANERQSDEIVNSPLGTMLNLETNRNTGLVQREGGKQIGYGISYHPWRDYAESVGEQGVKQLAEKLRPMSNADDVKDAMEHPQGAKAFLTKKHQRELPSSVEAHAVLQSAIEKAKTQDQLHGISKAVQEVHEASPNVRVRKELDAKARAAGYIPNRYAGTSASGKRVKAGEGFVKRNAAGKWETHHADDVRKVIGAESASATAPLQSSAGKAAESAYAYARPSAVANAGEDLADSARHKRNAWRGLSEAEANGTAEQLVTRDKLLENEPHNIAASVDKNPMTALAMHHAMKSLPPTPAHGRGYEKTSPELKAKHRQQFVETYNNIKAKAEELAATEPNPESAMDSLRNHVSKKIRELRGQEGESTISQLSAKDPYNPVANGLVGTTRDLNTWRSNKTSVPGKLRDFHAAIAKKYGNARSMSENPTGHMEDLAKIHEGQRKHAADIIGGKSLHESFGSESPAAGRQKKFSPADLYVGKPERVGGRDVSHVTANPNTATQHLLNSFKMRGVQWGNSVTDDERTHHAGHVVGALTDLAEATGLHPEDISLNGKLGLAIGARGHGGASAHYEPGNKVINLTRESGVGTLAHEWGHAFDHNLAGGNIINTGEKLAGDYQSGRTAMTRMVKAKPGEPSTYGGYKADEKGNPVFEDLSPDPVHAAMEGVRQSWQTSGFRKRLGPAIRELEKQGVLFKNPQYWRSEHEMFARTFENHVAHKLGEQGRKNTYLSGFSGNFNPNGPVTPEHLWPTKEESAHMAPAFDKLMSAYRQKKYGSSEPIKFSRAAAERIIELSLRSRAGRAA